MKRTIMMLSIVVLAISLTAVAADHRGLVTTQPKAGGTPYKDVEPMGTQIFNNLALDNPKGVYFCCSGYIVAGPSNPEGFYYWEALQFTLANPATVNTIKTSVNYILQGNTTDFLLSIQADASGIPSGTPLGSGPWTVDIDSQTYGQCCALETTNISGGLQLAAGTYWVVWSTESDSDLFAEVNVEVKDGVDETNAAYNYDGEGWSSYETTTGFSVKVK